MFRRAYEYIGSRRFSVVLLKILIVYFVCLALMRLTHTVPLFFYLVWGPLAMWGIFFAVNTAVSFYTQRYVHSGNMIFHAAFIIAAVGVLLSWAYRFEGGIRMSDGDVFFGEEADYEWHSAVVDFHKLAPKLSFMLSDVEPEFWAEKFYFTGLRANVEYPASTREKSGELRLNGGLLVEGARLRLTDYGYLPYVLLEKEGSMVYRNPLDVRVFPPGTDGVLEMKGYTVYVRVLPDPVMTPEGPKNRSVNVTDPVFIVRVEWLGREVYNGIVRRGEKIGFGPYDLTFMDLKRYVRVGVVSDPGEPFVFAAFLVALGGLVLRIGGALSYYKKSGEKA